MKFNSVKCPVCQKVTRNKYALNVHLQFHSPTIGQVCLKCGKVFFSMHGFKRHNAIAHKGKLKLKVYTEEKSFVPLNIKKNNVKTHPIKSECRVCLIGEKYPSAFNEFIKNIVVDFTISNKSVISNNIEYCDRINNITPYDASDYSIYACHTCNRLFGSKEHMTIHVVIYHQGELNCEECGKWFVFKSDLLHHMQKCGKRRHYAKDWFPIMNNDVPNNQKTFHSIMESIKNMGYGFTMAIECKKCGVKFPNPLSRFQHELLCFSHPNDKHLILLNIRTSNCLFVTEGTGQSNTCRKCKKIFMDKRLFNFHKEYTCMM